jgi:biopolymer transport protein ExbD
MAEINSNTNRGNKKGARSTKVSTKIDMTPMVDLAFLLITFFMLTTTFNKPSTMEVNMPDKKIDVTPVSSRRTLTFILAKDNRVYWYQGDNTAETMKLEKLDFTNTATLRKVLMEESLKIETNTKKSAVILVKSLDNAKYSNLVNILDELHITNQKIYAIVDVYDVEKDAIAKQFGV